MEKLEKMVNDVNRKFSVHVNILKAGGRLVVISEKGCTVDSKKMTDIREYLLMHAGELEE